MTHLLSSLKPLVYNLMRLYDKATTHFINHKVNQLICQILFTQYHHPG